MQQSVEAPTPKALADLVASCDEIGQRLRGWGFDGLLHWTTRAA